MDDINDFFASLDNFSAPSLTRTLDQLHTPSPAEVEEREQGDNINNTNNNNNNNRKRRRERERQSDSWSCPQCTLLNPLGATYCNACELPRPSSSSIATEDQAGWPCPRCTYLNASTATVCVLCDAPRVSFSPSLTPREPSMHSCRSRSDLPSSSSSEEEEDSEEDSDESEEGSGSSVSSGSTSSQQQADITDQAELVKFLEALDTVPSDDLPLAPIPLTMRPSKDSLEGLFVPPGAEEETLKPFQRQGLHWMMTQEKPKSAVPTVVVDDTTTASTSIARYSAREAPQGVSSERAAVHSVRGGILADYMGLGKTRTVIALCEATTAHSTHALSSSSSSTRLDSGVTGSQLFSHATLILCPSSLLNQWAEEIKRCVRPTPRICIYHGSTTRQKRMTMFYLASSFDYVLTSYHTLSHQILPTETTATALPTSRPPGVLYMIYWKRIVLDEAHIIRNTRTKLHKATVALSGRYRWAVTATPLQNSVNDIFSLLKFLQVPYFGDVRWWNREIVSYFNRDAQHPRPTTALRIVLGALLLRRTPDSVVGGQKILNLPPKTVEVKSIVLSAEEKVFYDAIHQSATKKLNHSTATTAASLALTSNRLLFSRAIEMLVRCRQVCLHPYIVVAALRRFHPELQPDGDGHTSDLSPTASPTHHEEAQKAKEKERQQSLFTEAVNGFIDTTLRRHTARTFKGGRLSTGGESGSLFLKELVSELRQQMLTQRECIICMESMVRPAILPCAHTFCQDCVLHAVEAQHRCPLCKRGVKKNEILPVPLQLLGDPVEGDHNKDKDNENKGKEEDEKAIDPSVVFSKVPLAVSSGPDVWPLELSAKTQYLLDQLLHVVPPTEQVVVFSYFTTYLVFLQHVLGQHHISCVSYTGTLTAKQKQSVLRQFSGESSTTNLTTTASSSPPDRRPRVLLASFSASNVGLNLVTANHCYLTEPSWNPGQVEQALHRVHRIGQTKPVRIVKLLAKDTVEEKVEALCERKSSLGEYYCSYAGGRGRGGGGRLRTQELVSLFVDPVNSSDTSFSSTSSSSSSSEE